MTDLALKHGLTFPDLYDRDGLIRLDRVFVAHLAATDAALHERLMTGRGDPEALDHKAESDLLVDLAPHAEDFLGDLFGIAGEVGPGPEGVAEATAWERLGATHLSVTTMGAGLATPAEHVTSLLDFKKRWDSR